MTGRYTKGMRDFVTIKRSRHEAVVLETYQNVKMSSHCRTNHLPISSSYFLVLLYVYIQNEQESLVQVHSSQKLKAKFNQSEWVFFFSYIFRDRIYLSKKITERQPKSMVRKGTKQRTREKGT